jgi:hypothetical protein
MDNTQMYCPWHKITLQMLLAGFLFNNPVSQDYKRWEAEGLA